MRVVLDTNILVRAVARPDGPAGELFDLIRSPHLLIISLEMLTELYDVLTRDRIRRLHGLPDEKILEFVEHLETGSLVVLVPRDAVPVVVPADRDDDVVIATAIAGQANVLCTLDRHLHAQHVRDYCADRGIRVETDIDLLNELRSPDDPA